MSAEHHFGGALEPIPVDVTTADGHPRHCVGPLPSTAAQCYGWISECGAKVPIATLSYCAACAKSLPADRRYSHTLPQFYSNNCDTYKIDKSLSFGVDNRALVNYHGMRVYLNAFDPTQVLTHRRRALTKVRRPEAELKGLLTVNVPSFTCWELLIQGDPTGKFKDTTDMYYKVTSAHTGLGKHKRNINITSTTGSKDFYMPLSVDAAPLTINSYDNGNVFIFQAPSAAEKENGLAAAHDTQSNKVFFTVHIYRRVPAVKPTPSASIDWEGIQDRMYQGEGSDEDVEFGFPNPHAKGGSTPRPGWVTTTTTTTRGPRNSKGGGGPDPIFGGYASGPSKSRGGGSAKGSFGVSSCPVAEPHAYGGGSNFAMQGKTHRTQVAVSEDTFVHSGDPPVYIAVELVNSESEEERLRCSKLVHATVERANTLKRRAAVLGQDGDSAATAAVSCAKARSEQVAMML
jgi:hypothetical protein